MVHASETSDDKGENDEARSFFFFTNTLGQFDPSRRVLRSMLFVLRIAFCRRMSVFIRGCILIVFLVSQVAFLQFSEFRHHHIWQPQSDFYSNPGAMEETLHGTSK